MNASEVTDDWLRRATRHIHQHPYRLVVTIGFLLVMSWAAAGAALLHSFHVEHTGRVENCLAINELNRELGLAWTDAGYPFIGARFEVTYNCEALP